MRRPDKIVGPNGERLTLASLPAANTVRWVPRRKAEVVAAIAGGLLTFDEACSHYSLTVEELTSWQRFFEFRGVKGLRVTALQSCRDALKRDAGN